MMDSLTCPQTVPVETPSPLVPTPPVITRMIGSFEKFFPHMGHSRNASACSAISFLSSILSETISENYPCTEPESDCHGGCQEVQRGRDRRERGETHKEERGRTLVMVGDVTHGGSHSVLEGGDENEEGEDINLVVQDVSSTRDVRVNTKVKGDDWVVRNNEWVKVDTNKKTGNSSAKDKVKVINDVIMKDPIKGKDFLNVIESKLKGHSSTNVEKEIVFGGSFDDIGVKEKCRVSSNVSIYYLVYNL